MKQRRPPRKKPAIAGQLRPEEARLVRSLVEALPEAELPELIRPLTAPHLAEALIEAIPLDEPAVPDLLCALQAAFPQKPVQKAVKRAFFRLRSRGIAVPQPAAESPPPPVRRPPAESPVAKLGPPDGDGSRAVFLALPQAVQGFDVGIGLISDERGFIHFLAGSYSKKRMRELADGLAEESGFLVDVPLSHAAAVLESTYARHSDPSAEGPAAYLSLRSRLLDLAGPPERPALHDLVAEAALPAGDPTLSELRRLMDHRLLQTWLLDPDALRPLLQALSEARESPLLLSELQRRERWQAIKAKWLSEHYSDARLAILKDRFEEMALILLKQGEPETARLAVTAARSLVPRGPLAAGNPVLLFMLERSLRFYADLAEQAGPEDAASDTEEPLIRLK